MHLRKRAYATAADFLLGQLSHLLVMIQLIQASEQPKKKETTRFMGSLLHDSCSVKRKNSVRQKPSNFDSIRVIGSVRKEVRDTLGTRIALLRRRIGLSQKELARRLSLSPSAIGMYEQDRRAPSNDLLIEMAKIFGVSTDFLLTGEASACDASAMQELAQKLRTHLRPEVSAEDTAALLSTLLTVGELTNDEKSSMIGAGGEPMTDELYMQEALRLAQEAAQEGEVPVGCVIVDGERIVGRGRNRRETAKNALAHAEIEAIDEACRTLGGWRLWRCTMYVTLEPCPMCTGAIINARIARLVYGASDLKAGSCGSLTDLFALPYNSKPEVTRGVLAQEAKDQLQDFFRNLRANPTVKTWKKE